MKRFASLLLIFSVLFCVGCDTDADPSFFLDMIKDPADATPVIECLEEPPIDEGETLTFTLNKQCLVDLSNPPASVETTPTRESEVDITFSDFSDVKDPFGIEPDLKPRYGFDPAVNNGKHSWDPARHILLNRPNSISIPIWIVDPERDCNRNDRQDLGFIAPVRLEIFNWHTKEFYRANAREGQERKRTYNRFFHDHTTWDGYCPRDWHYRSRVTIYFKDIPSEKNNKSRKFSLSPEDLGIRIYFENGEEIDYRLDVVYSDFPLLPEFILEENN